MLLALYSRGAHTLGPYALVVAVASDTSNQELKSSGHLLRLRLSL
jgi:hypothetical protein